MSNYLKHIATGNSLPFGNPHAVSVSLPTIKDIIGYEEKDKAVTGKMQAGYPRFFMNKLVARLVERVREQYNIPPPAEVLPVMNEKALELILLKLQLNLETIVAGDCGFVVIDKAHPQLTLVKDHIRQAGLFLSSRKAEDILHQLGLINGVFEEEAIPDGKHRIVSQLNNAYNAQGIENVLLTSCGMNAIYSVFEAVRSANEGTAKKAILQIGCLYVDSDQLIKRMSDTSLLVPVSSDTNLIRELIKREHRRIAAVFTEVPNNPLIDCVDLPALHSVCRQYDIPLIVDATFGTPHNVDVLPWCDIAVESLTKFACGHGDSIMGAIVLNSSSYWPQNFSNEIKKHIIQPYDRDTNRLAVGMADYGQRMKIVSFNTQQLISYLENSPVVKEVYSIFRQPGYNHFLQIQKHPDALPGLISVEFKSGLRPIYDRLALPKGPSLGTNFTLAMPYVYLAHYDLLKTAQGHEHLKMMGLPVELLRFSVGLEPVDEIIEVFKKAGI